MPRVLQPLGDLDDILRILVPPQPRLDRHGQTDRLDDAARHLDHFRHVAHHAAAGSAPGDLAHRAAEIDVDQVGSGRLGHTGRLDHRFDLDGRKAECRPAARNRTDVELGHRLGRIADQPVARNELRVDHIGPEHLAHVSGTTDRSRLPSARETEACRPNRFRCNLHQAQKYEKDSGYPRHPGTERYASRSVPERYSRRLSDADRFRTRSPVPGNRPHGTCGRTQLLSPHGRVCRRPPRRDFALKM